jgi:hypothetical protein
MMTRTTSKAKAAVLFSAVSSCAVCFFSPLFDSVTHTHFLTDSTSLWLDWFEQLMKCLACDVERRNEARNATRRKGEKETERENEARASDDLIGAPMSPQRR